MTHLPRTQDFAKAAYYAPALLVAIGFAALLFWVNQTNFYYQHFNDTEGVTCYQIARLLFIPCLAWLVYAAGAGVLFNTTFMRLPAWERYPLGFLVGAAVWHIGLFALGMAGLYTKPIAILLTLMVMVRSIPHLAFCIDEALHGLKRMPLWPVLFFAAAAALFLLTKGLYPTGGHDYYNHYFPFYRKVVESGSILPNEVWYHFFYSKGLGLYFFAMLIFDPLAPQLVTTGFIGAGAWMVFALLRRELPHGILPWVGAIFYVLFFIYTPGLPENMRHGGWGDLEKSHEIAAVLILGLLWAGCRLCDGPTRAWGIGLMAAAATLPLVTFATGFIGGAMLALIAVVFAWQKQWGMARPFIVAGIAAGLMLGLIMAINYAYTGFPSDHLIMPFWPLADLTPIKDWGTTFELFSLNEIHTKFANDTVPLGLKALIQAASYLRLELWLPLFLIPALAMLCHRKPLLKTEWVLLGFAGIVLVLGLTIARSQPISFYRMSSFSYAPMLCLALLLWRHVPERWLTRGKVRLVSFLLITCLIFGSLVLSFTLLADTLPGRVVARMQSDVSNVFNNAFKLADGTYSLKDAYQNQQGWPGRMPWGGIYPPIENVLKEVPHGERIWSFHVHSYCMLPDCNVESYMSFRFSPSWPEVYFGHPAEAAAQLKAEGLRYFFYSKELAFHDPLPASPLFSPEHIGDYLGIKWTDGTNYLLTWKGADTKPLGKEFLEAYAESATSSVPAQDFKKHRHGWLGIAAGLAEGKRRGGEFTLPWQL